MKSNLVRTAPKAWPGAIGLLSKAAIGSGRFNATLGKARLNHKQDRETE